MEPVNQESIKKCNTIIIGAGLTGLSSGYHLKDNYVIFEAKPWTGGLAGSYHKEGFTFDHGGVHVLRTDDNYLKGKAKPHYNKLQRDLLEFNVVEKEKRAFVYFQGKYHVRPFQHNLHGASQEVIKECLDGFYQRPNFSDDQKDDFMGTTKTFANFKEEIEAVFGSGLCKHFMYPYNKKAWCTKIENIRSKLWISKKFGTTFDENEFLDGIKYPNGIPKTLIRYPKKGGFGATGAAIYNKIEQNVLTGARATNIDTQNKIITIGSKDNNGNIQTQKYQYNNLVSTIPIPELIKIIPSATQEVKQAASEYIFTSMLCVNIAIDKPVWTNKQYIYYPEESISFTRVSFPLNQSKEAAPEGKTGICLEVPYSKEMPLGNEQEMVDRCMQDLIKTGILKGDEKILFIDVKHVKYSYVVQNVTLNENSKIVQQFLRPFNIYSIGRYGEWKHSGTEHAIDDGRKIAEKLTFNK